MTHCSRHGIETPVFSQAVFSFVFVAHALQNTGVDPEYS